MVKDFDAPLSLSKLEMRVSFCAWADCGVVFLRGRVDGNKAGEIWAIALSNDGEYLASTAYDGRINVWQTGGERRKIREFETKGSFGMCIDLVSPFFVNNWAFIYTTI